MRKQLKETATGIYLWLWFDSFNFRQFLINMFEDDTIFQKGTVEILKFTVIHFLVLQVKSPQHRSEIHSSYFHSVEYYVQNREQRQFSNSVKLNSH